MEEIASIRIRTIQMYCICCEMYQKSYKSRNDMFTLTREKRNEIKESNDRYHGMLCLSIHCIPSEGTK